jgi:hypothetical protein
VIIAGGLVYFLLVALEAMITLARSVSRSGEDHGDDKRAQAQRVGQHLYIEPGPVLRLRALEANDSLGRAIREPFDNSSTRACLIAETQSKRGEDAFGLRTTTGLHPTAKMETGVDRLREL